MSSTTWFLWKGSLRIFLFAPLWQDSNLLEVILESQLLYLHSTPLHETIITRPCFVNDTLLLNSLDFTDAEPHRSVCQIKAFNTFLLFDSVKLYEAEEDAVEPWLGSSVKVTEETTGKSCQCFLSERWYFQNILDDLASIMIFFFFFFFMWCKHRLAEWFLSMNSTHNVHSTGNI